MDKNTHPRPDPRGKPVSLFVTCMVDMLAPEVGMSVVAVLEHLGVTVTFSENQTCCGQPGFNGGFWEEARTVARHFLRVFADADVIVVPSGSCAAMVRHEYPRLFADDPKAKAQAEAIAARTWEFTEYIVEGLGITDLKARLPHPQTFAFHDACHGLRVLGLGNEARTLVAGVENATVTELAGCDQCCGFGGLFAVKMADISGAMLAKKTRQIRSCPAQVLTGDLSCMLHMNGGLAQQGVGQRVRHVAELLAEGLGERDEA